VPFLGGGGVYDYDLFFSNFFYPRRISMGVLPELKIPRSERHLLKPEKLGPL
jgi:hypothetical protein